jgi:ankyrin repeat protein
VPPRGHAADAGTNVISLGGHRHCYRRSDAIITGSDSASAPRSEMRGGPRTSDMQSDRDARAVPDAGPRRRELRLDGVAENEGPSHLDSDTLAFAHQMFDLARSGSTDELAAYVDAGLPANLTNDNGDTLLILAAYHDHPETVAALLGRGADHARVNDRGQTALAAAVFRNSAATVAALLAADADPEMIELLRAAGD